ncbi:gluconokinase [Formicincola oecophyllae]|uniref:Gluconokinase n=1 Tax=Formicincola oecophyllae TaxID=2558361 RepID=A0A4Y6UA97_9PROT|nr:gluconokinase [Formicincola oecophyllae]QDH14429.1 gluconokinase [Formicincola oecophyllae]
MGVSGTGKTSVAQALARREGWPFMEGDSLHPAANVAKMHAGHPLTDADRAPWLKICHDWLAKEAEAGRGAILTCSALKRKYRDQLAKDLPVQFIYLRVKPDIVAQRLNSRVGHFMPPSLLPSQFATLEEPDEDEPVIVAPGDKSLEEIVDYVVNYLDKHPMDPKTRQVENRA